jgi:hypothetical protein
VRGGACAAAETAAVGPPPCSLDAGCAGFCANAPTTRSLSPRRSRALLRGPGCGGRPSWTRSARVRRRARRGGAVRVDGSSGPRPVRTSATFRVATLLRRARAGSLLLSAPALRRRRCARVSFGCRRRRGSTIPSSWLRPRARPPVMRWSTGIELSPFTGFDRWTPVMHDGQPPHSNAWPLRSGVRLYRGISPAGWTASLSRRDRDASPLEPLCPNLFGA